MSNFQLDGETAINDLLDQVAFLSREKAALQMQLSSALKQLDKNDESSNTEEVTADGSNTV